jgi:hypothetical protein
VIPAWSELLAHDVDLSLEMELLAELGRGCALDEQIQRPRGKGD